MLSYSKPSSAFLIVLQAEAESGKKEEIRAEHRGF